MQIILILYYFWLPNILYDEIQVVDYVHEKQLQSKFSIIKSLLIGFEIE